MAHSARVDACFVHETVVVPSFSPIWIMKQKDWFKPRGYLHIDNKIKSENRGFIVGMIQDPNYVAHHAFMPLLYKTVKQRRYKAIEKDEDGVSVSSHKKLNEKGFKESTAKLRPIHYASHIDSQIYAYYANQIIAPRYESILKEQGKLSECITAYRKILSPDGLKNKNNVHFANDIFEEIKRRGECAAVAFDIKSFFSSLDLRILKERWQFVMGTDKLDEAHYNIFKSVTAFRYIHLDELRIKGKGFDEKRIANYRQCGIESFFGDLQELRDKIKSREIHVQKNYFRNKQTNKPEGIPQGLPISAILANLYMLEFDKEIYTKLVIDRDCYFRRYSDDIVVVCKVELIDEVIKIVSDTIKGEKANLRIADEKTEICKFKNIIIGDQERLQVYKSNGKEFKENVPFVYLGFEFYGYQKLLKSASLARFYRRMKESVRKHSRRAQRRMDFELLDKKIIFKTRLYRMFTYKGQKSRLLRSKRATLKKDIYGHFHFVTTEREKKFRGNFLRYATRASADMQAPEIRRQIRNHWKIMQKAIERHDFKNI